MVWAHGAYHELLSALAVEISAAPQDEALYLRRAKLHLSHESWVEAVADLERVDRLKPDARLTDGLRGQALNQGREWEAALAALEAHLSLFPGDVEARFERGRARFQLLEPSAVADVRAAIAAFEAPDPWKVLLAADVLRRFEGARSAGEFLGKIIQDHGAEPSLLERAISISLEIGEYDDALRYVEGLKGTAPRAETLMARRARILEQAGRRQEAQSAWAVLHEHLLGLPNLERGTPLLSELLSDARQALGLAAPGRVVAPPAPRSAP